MFYKPLFIVHGRFQNLYWSTKTKRLSSKSGRGTRITKLHKREISSLSADK